jgi:hypothetical protein
VWAKATLRVADRLDNRSRSALQATPRPVTVARVFLAENGGRGDAAEIRFVGPDRYELTNARYTTCVARDWYFRIGELEVDKTRMVGTARAATIHLRHADRLYAVARIPALE